MFKKLLTKVYSIIYCAIGKLPVKNKTFVFESFSGKQYSDNPKAVYLYMLKHYPEYKLYWSFNRRHFDSLKKHVDHPLRRFGLRWLFVMPRASYWVINSRLPSWIQKPKETTYVQTWHGTPLKKLGIDIDKVHMPGTTTEKYKKNFTNEVKKWDVLVSPNAYSTDVFKGAFQFEKEVIESGYPRNDILYAENNEETIIELKRKLQLPTNKKVLLYAPTWRDNDFYDIGKYKMNLQLDLQQMKRQLKDTYVILIRAHYLIAENLDLSTLSGFAYDVSSYPDINDLYLISDMLITDYSSVFFDYANLKRPMIFFTYDMEEYRDYLRGFYFDFEKEAPGPIVATTEGVIREVKKLETREFKTDGRFEAFYNLYCSLEDGSASERVVQNILKK